MRWIAPILIPALALLTGLLPAARPAVPSNLPLLRVRQKLSDLEVAGLLQSVPAGVSRFLSYDALLALSQVTETVTNDESFAALHASSVRVSGVPLADLERALKMQPSSDLISARCSDGYEAHYPVDYVHAHHPLLVLKVDGLTLSAWAAKRNVDDPGPYMITNPHFVPAHAVLAHQDKPQYPDEVVRLDFTTQDRVYGAIVPRGRHAGAMDEKNGYAIARENCLRCHGVRQPDGTWIGGSKAQRSWQLLSHLATDDPVTFAAIIRNPRSVNPRSTMPGNPQYDGPTLAALTAYFKSFSEAGDSAW